MSATNKQSDKFYFDFQKVMNKMAKSKSVSFGVMKFL